MILMAAQMYRDGFQSQDFQQFRCIQPLLQSESKVLLLYMTLYVGVIASTFHNCATVTLGMKTLMELLSNRVKF